jgi:hypothetical protein
MSNKKITDLVALTGANTTANDLLVIVDTDEDETKKITREEFFKNIQGNVGIGTNSPQEPLHIAKSGVNGNIRAHPYTDGGELDFFNSTTFLGTYGVDSTAAFAGSWSNVPFDLYTNTALRFRIASDGQLSAVVPGGSTLYPSFTARAWVNFNGTGTVAIRASGNVSSVTDLGTGAYRVNFTTAMPDTNYAVTGMIGSDSGVWDGDGQCVLNSFDNLTTSSFGFVYYEKTLGFRDMDRFSVSVLR